MRPFGSLNIGLDNICKQKRWHVISTTDVLARSRLKRSYFKAIASIAVFGPIEGDMHLSEFNNVYFLGRQLIVLLRVGPRGSFTSWYFLYDAVPQGIK
jgi:hypothetical protein